MPRRTKTVTLPGNPEVEDWTGRSLAFIRQVTRNPARYSSAAAAAAESDITVEGEPPVGAFCWYRSQAHPHGNVSLYLGGHASLCVGHSGRPQVLGYLSPVLGEYQGWSEEIGYALQGVSGAGESHPGGTEQEDVGPS